MLICCSAHLLTQWLVLVCALTGDGTRDPGASGRRSDRLSRRPGQRRPSRCHQVAPRSSVLCAHCGPPCTAHGWWEAGSAALRGPWEGRGVPPQAPPGAPGGCSGRVRREASEPVASCRQLWRGGAAAGGPARGPGPRGRGPTPGSPGPAGDPAVPTSRRRSTVGPPRPAGARAATAPRRAAAAPAGRAESSPAGAGPGGRHPPGPAPASGLPPSAR